jgi:hypothetical protein
VSAKHEKGRIPDQIDYDLLKDVPAWLRSLRLHKYTGLFWPTEEYLLQLKNGGIDSGDDFLESTAAESGSGGYSAPPSPATSVSPSSASPSSPSSSSSRKFWNWREMVMLEDEDLQRIGVHALGARRKMLKVFEIIRKDLTA